MQLTDTSENPPVTPGPITRRWYFNGDLVYESALGTAPTVSQEFIAKYPSLDPEINLILYANQGWITIYTTDVEFIFKDRTDISFSAVYGNWTCSLTNPLGTDVARFGTILRECGKKICNATTITRVLIHPAVFPCPDSLPTHKKNRVGGSSQPQ